MVMDACNANVQGWGVGGTRGGGGSCCPQIHIIGGTTKRKIRL